MPRRNSRAPLASSAQPAGSARALSEQVELFGGQPYRVRSLRGGGDGGPYRCPGCDHQVAVGAAHIVAWAQSDADALDRRHWHGLCWSRRETARPSPRRGRR
ncbi:MAG: hypothetical protein LBQ06_02390 [Frankiaceae bacterium]|nr:hypothetical protein [Frankiaceae bacterium]